MIRLLRFRDLQARGIINSWPMLRRRIEFDGFPRGFMAGPNTRRWREDEVEAWIESRPVAGPAPRGIAKANRERARSKANNTTTTTTA
jgi:predicted DNA-binding transcriptional regulator AlpA